ncbi:MAG: hypothetical protein GEV07_04085 [Streptosporangiales bacterium]|nr:hypothetical protein [Streptosporangiales bacterium]
MARMPLGEILDSLGVSADLGADDRVADAVVLLKIKNGDEVSVAIEQSDHTDWYDQRALISAAAAVVENSELKRC